MLLQHPDYVTPLINFTIYGTRNRYMGWGCGFNNWSILIPKLLYLLRFVTLERPIDKALLC